MERKAFSSCTQDKELVSITPNSELAVELIALAEQRISFWEKASLDEEYPTLYFEGYYEIIKELATALLAVDGWKSTNYECLFAYLKSKGVEIDYALLYELKDLRNKINYRGAVVSASLWKRSKPKIYLIIRTLLHYAQGSY